MDKVVVTSEAPSSPKKTSLDPQDDVGEVASQFVELSPPPTPPSLDICTDLDCNPDGCHLISFSHALSSGSYDPLDFIVLCSFVSNSTTVVDEDQVVDGFGVEKLTYAVIYDEYVWESKEEPTVKDDLILYTPHPLYLDIFRESSISVFPCENSYLDVSASDHSQNTQDISPSFDFGDEKYFFMNPPNVSSFISVIT